MYFGSISQPLSELNNEVNEELSKEIDKCTKELLEYLNINCPDKFSIFECIMIREELQKKGGSIFFNSIDIKTLNTKGKEISLLINGEKQFTYKILIKLKDEKYIITTKLLDLRGDI